MAWIEQKQRFQKRFDILAQYNINSLIAELNKEIGSYIKTAGIGTRNDQTYTNIIKLTSRIEYIKNVYATLHHDIIEFISKESKDHNLSGLLTENGELQKQIRKLEKIEGDMKVDVESSIARDTILRSRDTDISRHKLFILDRPLRTGMIPYLWVLGVIFVGVALVIFKMSFPNIFDINIAEVFPMILQYITNTYVLGSILIVALIVIVLLSLKISGVFGKNKS